jgi:signal transduction histidine kinase
MVPVIFISLATALQFGAFFITLSLIHKTKFRVSWISISIGFLLMSVQRLAELYRLSGQSERELLMPIFAFSLSLLMFIASFYIRQIFLVQERVNSLRRENEAKVLKAIIRTEENDRKNFSKDLHDGIGPLLASVKMGISAVNKTGLSALNKEIIEKTENSIDSAVEALREISNSLSPQVLVHFGVEKAAKKFISNLILPEGSVINFNSTLAQARYDYDTELVIYRIISELLGNAIKHSQASIIELTVYEYAGSLNIIYSDNGVGFSKHEKENTGMGMYNLQSRVKSLGGEISIEGHKNKGVFVKISLPAAV